MLTTGTRECIFDENLEYLESGLGAGENVIHIYVYNFKAYETIKERATFGAREIRKLWDRHVKDIAVNRCTLA